MWVPHSTTSRGAGPLLACLILVGATHLSSLGEERMHLRCTNIPCLRGCIQDSAMHLGLRGGSDIVPEDVEGVSSLDEDKEDQDDRIHWRGKEGGEDDGERMSLEKRLRDLREMYEQGVLDKGEHDKEKARLLEACAMVGQDLDEIYRHDDEKDDFERYKDAENYTIARRANNNIAKKMAYGFPEVNDMSAMGVRINGGLDFTDEDFAWMRRYKQREKLERKAGLAHGDLRDMRSVWKEATHRLYRELTDENPRGKPLTEVSFLARRDLGVGEIITCSMRNYTRNLEEPNFDSQGSDDDGEDHAFVVESSPYGKITKAVWGHSMRILNFTVSQPIFQDEPIRIEIPASSGICADNSSFNMDRSQFMDLLFSRPLPPISATSTSSGDGSQFPTTERMLQEGDEVVIKGLTTSSELNGCRAKVVARSGTRYKVMLLDGSRKVLLRGANVEGVVEGEKAGHALGKDAEGFMKRMYQGGGGDEKGVEAGGVGAKNALSEADIGELAALNITVAGDEINDWQTPHFDNGIGRFIVTPFTDDDELYVSQVMRGGRARDRPVTRAKQLLIDHHLQMAALEGDADRIEALVAAGGNLSTTRFPGTYHGENDRMPLHVATYEQHPQAVRALLFLGADVNCFDGHRMTPLHLAAVKGNVDLLNILLDARADLSLKNEWNRTAVHRAFFYGHQEAANLLIDRAGPDFDTRDIEEIARLESVDPEVAKKFKYLD